MFTKMQKEICVALIDLFYNEGGFETYQQKDTDVVPKMCSVISIPDDENEYGYSLFTKKFNGDWYIAIRRTMNEYFENEAKVIAYILVESCDMTYKQAGILSMLDAISMYVDP